MATGTFIVLEGPDGSGTTSHCKLLAERLTKEGKDVFLTAEPTTGPIGTFIRQQLSKEGNSVTSAALQLLFTADRAWHVEQVIQPALAEGKTVICERFSMSTVVYGEALGLDAAWLAAANDTFPKPDLLLVTLPDFETALRRINERATKDIMEEKIDLQRRLNDLYRSHATESGAIIIDTSGNMQEVAETIYQTFIGSRTL